jgi:hypothetical protein
MILQFKKGLLCPPEGRFPGDLFLLLPRPREKRWTDYPVFIIYSLELERILC